MHPKMEMTIYLIILTDIEIKQLYKNQQSNKRHLHWMNEKITLPEKNINMSKYWVKIQTTKNVYKSDQ